MMILIEDVTLYVSAKNSDNYKGVGLEFNN